MDSEERMRMRELFRQKDDYEDDSNENSKIKTCWKTKCFNPIFIEI